MEFQQFNLQLVRALNEWDPFGCGEGGYDTEIADVVYAIHDMNNKSGLARKIQTIYEFSFEQMIPMESCLHIAEKLLAIKAQSSCTF